MSKWKAATLILVAIAGGLLVYYSTSLGPFVGSDSVEYIMGAKNLLTGHGLTNLTPAGSYQPITIHPPLYSLCLALFNILGFTWVAAARWLSIVIMVATVTILGLGIYRFSSSYLLAIATSLVFAFSAPIQKVYYEAMSDGLSLLITFAALLVLVHLIQKPSKSFLVIFAILSALLVLTRYIGLAIVPTGVLLLLAVRSDTWSTRLKLISSYLGLFILFLLPYLVYSFLSTNSVSDRNLVGASNLWSSLTPFRAGLVKTLWSWLPFSTALPAIPYLLKVLILSACYIFVFGPLFFVIKRKTRRNETFSQVDILLPVVFLTYGILFLATFVVVWIFTLPIPSVDSRTLIPLFPILVLAFFSTLWLWAKELREPNVIWLQILTGLLCILLLAGFLPVTWSLIAGWHAEGSGGCGIPKWVDSEVIPAINNLPASTPLIASDEACIYLYTGRRPYDLRELHISDLQHVQRFGDDLSDPLQVLFREQRGALIITSEFQYYVEEKYSFHVSGMALIQTLTAGLELHSYHDGSIYFYP